VHVEDVESAFGTALEPALKVVKHLQRHLIPPRTLGKGQGGRKTGSTRSRYRTQCCEYQC
jgi:hypothetical protein